MTLPYDGEDLFSFVDEYRAARNTAPDGRPIIDAALPGPELIPDRRVLHPETPTGPGWEPYYQDESVTLYHGNCREITTWLNADVLVTDPPYGVNWSSGLFSNEKTTPRTTVIGDTDASVRDEALGLWGKDRPALVFGSWRVARPTGTLNRLIWYKAANKPAFRIQPWYATDEEIYQIGTGFVGKPEHNVLVTHDARDGAYGEVARWGHPTPKPVGLLERLIRKCPPGVVADPFAGTGSTLVAARNLRRRAVGVELEERYCETIARRLSADVLDLGGLPPGRLGDPE